MRNWILLLLLGAAFSPLRAAVLPEAESNISPAGAFLPVKEIAETASGKESFLPEGGAKTASLTGSFFNPGEHRAITPMPIPTTATVQTMADPKAGGFFPWGVRGSFFYVDAGAILLGLAAEQSMPGVYPSFPVPAKFGWEMTLLGVVSLGIDLSLNSYSYILGLNKRTLCITFMAGADLRLYPLFFLETASGFWISGGGGFASGWIPKGKAANYFFDTPDYIVPQIPVIRGAAGYKLLISHLILDYWFGYELCPDAPSFSGIRMGLSLAFR